MMGREKTARCGTCSQRLNSGGCRPGSGWGWCPWIDNYTHEEQKPNDLDCTGYNKKSEE